MRTRQNKNTKRRVQKLECTAKKVVREWVVGESRIGFHYLPITSAKNLSTKKLRFFAAV